jgi:transcriptional antiterminator RfaH
MKIIKQPVHWYAACTLARCEKQVKRFLDMEAIENYLPIQRRLKQWSDRKKWVEEPLIRSYIFVRVKANQIHHVLQIQGIWRVVRFNNVYAPIPDKQIDMLKSLLASGAEIEVIEDTIDILPGDPVRVKAGPMMGLSGSLVEHRGKRVVLVQLHHIGRSLLVHFPKAYIERETCK